jgi:hypothetical protein
MLHFLRLASCDMWSLAVPLTRFAGEGDRA